MAKGETKKVLEVVNGEDVLKNKFANVYQRFGSSLDLERKGVVMDYKCPHGTFSLKIKRAGARNPEWKKIYNEVMKPVAEDIVAGKVSEADNKILLAEVWSKSVVVGWAGVINSDGEEVPFSVETCYELFCYMPDLLNDVIADSHLLSNFQDEVKIKTAKN
jgi:hypothetical protein